MIQVPRYFLLVSGAPDTVPRKFWTKEEAIDYLANDFHATKKTQFIEIQSDSGQLIYSKDEILALVKSQRNRKTMLPAIALLFLGGLFAPAPFNEYFSYLYIVVFVRFFLISGRGVIAFNRSLRRRFSSK